MRSRCSLGVAHQSGRGKEKNSERWTNDRRGKCQSLISINCPASPNCSCGCWQFGRYTEVWVRAWQSAPYFCIYHMRLCHLHERRDGHFGIDQKHVADDLGGSKLE